MREKNQTEMTKTLETPVLSGGIEILTEKSKFSYRNFGLDMLYLVSAGNCHPSGREIDMEEQSRVLEYKCPCCNAALVFGGNLIADLLYGVVDPKIRARIKAHRQRGGA